MAGLARIHTLTCSEQDDLDMPVHLTYTFLGCGRKLNTQSKSTQTGGETANSTETVAPAGNHFFPPHERYNQTTLNKRTLFEYLLYFG